MWIHKWGQVRGRLRKGELTSLIDLAYADSTLFSAMSFDILHGDQRPFSTSNEVVLTAATARRFAQDGDIGRLIGRQLTFFTGGNERHEVVVSAITYDVPSRSSLWFEALLPFDTMPEHDESGSSERVTTFLMLEDAEQRQEIEKELPAFGDRYFDQDFQMLRDEGEWSKDDNPFALHLEPIAEMYAARTPGSRLRETPEQVITIVGVLGSLVLLVGCVNFTVLSLGRSIRRSKEIGLRKVSGAYRSHIIRQHVIEAVLLSTVALVVGAALATRLLPEVSSLFALPNYSLRWVHTPFTWAFAILLPVFVGCLAGFYPAYALSRIDPVISLKGGNPFGNRNRFGRRLVIVQFSTTAFLLASTQVILDQIHHIRTFERGFDMSTLLYIDANSFAHRELHEKYRARISNIPGVEGVFGVSTGFGGGAHWYRSTEADLSFNYLGVTPNFVSTLGLEIVAGRDFRTVGPVDQVLVNEVLGKAMGWDDPIGQVVPFEVGAVDHPRVVGVIKDFHFASPRVPIRPLVLHRDPTNNTDRTYVKMARSKVGELQHTLEEAWRKVALVAPSHIRMMGEEFRQNESAEQAFFESLGYAASLFGLIISCLGLFGLAQHTLSQRTKEIGVRKVLGASIPSVLFLLSRHLISLAVFGCVLGSIASYFAVDEYIAGSTNQIRIGIAHFLWPSLGIVVIAGLSTCYHTVKAAFVDPAEEMRHE